MDRWKWLGRRATRIDGRRHVFEGVAASLVAGLITIVLYGSGPRQDAHLLYGPSRLKQGREVQYTFFVKAPGVQIVQLALTLPREVAYVGSDGPPPVRQSGRLIWRLPVIGPATHAMTFEVRAAHATPSSKRSCMIADSSVADEKRRLARQHYALCLTIRP